MNKYAKKKSEQLGMNISTAQGRLSRDILFSLVAKLGYKCYRCNKELTRETFSIEHKEPWLDSDNPVGKFFDLNNISFSHLNCNCALSKNPRQKYFNDEDRAIAKKEMQKKYKQTTEYKIKRRNNGW